MNVLGAVMAMVLANAGAGLVAAKDDPVAQAPSYVLYAVPRTRLPSENLERPHRGRRQGSTLRASLQTVSLAPGSPLASGPSRPPSEDVLIEEIRAATNAAVELTMAGRYEQAIAAYQPILKLVEERAGPFTSVGAYLLYAIGVNYKGKGDLDAGEAALTRALDIVERGSGDGLKCLLLDELGQFSEERRSWDRAIQWYSKALDCLEASMGAANDRTQATLYRLTWAYRFPLNRPDLLAKGRELTAAWLPKLEKALGPDDRKVAQLWFESAKFHSALRDPARARADRLKALSIAEKQPDPKNPDRKRLELEADVILDLNNATLASEPEAPYVLRTQRRAEILEALYGRADKRAMEARSLADLTRTNHPELFAQAAQPTPVSVASTAAPAPQNTDLGGGVFKAASNKTRSGKPIAWPPGMEPGNLYFVDNASRRLLPGPIMVSAPSGEEAARRVFAAEVDSRKNMMGSSRVASPYAVVPNGECAGPTWGAVVSKERAWGGGCGATPALAIEAAFAACAKARPDGCNKTTGEPGTNPEVTVALSGSTSNNTTYCYACHLPVQAGFASFAATSDNMLRNGSTLEDFDDVISKLDKPCGNAPCFYSPNNVGCYDNTVAEVRGPACADPRLTADGYSGPINRDAPSAQIPFARSN